MPIKIQVPKDFQGKKELQRIIVAANCLNSKLEKIYVFRSHKDRNTGKVYSIKKKWLQLELVTVERGGFIKHPPLPAVVIINPEKLTCHCNKCGFKWKATYEEWTSMNCPKCNSFEIGINDNEEDE